MVESSPSTTVLRKHTERPEDAPSFLRFTREQYHKLAGASVLQADRHYELINGFIYQVHPVGSEHSYAVKRIYDLLASCVGDDAAVFSQSPIHLPNHSEPEPDIVLLKPPSEQYRERLPEPADILLIVEVSKSTLQFDRTVKLELYARANIPEYWIVDLHKMRLEVYRDPDTGEERYRTMQTFDEGQTVAPVAFETCELDWWR